MTHMTKLHPFHEEVANMIKDASTPSEVAAIRSTLEVLNHRAEAKLRLLARKEKPQYSEVDLMDFLDVSGPNLAGYFDQRPEIAYTTRRTVENLIFNIHQHFPNQKYQPRTNTVNPGSVTLDTPGLYFSRWIITHCSVGWPAANICCLRINSKGAVENYQFWWVSDAIKRLVQGESCTDIIAAKEEEDGC